MPAFLGGVIPANNFAAVGGGGSSYPALTLTSPTFDTSAPKWGAAALSGGSGSASIPNASPDAHGQITLEAWVRCPALNLFQPPIMTLFDGTNYASIGTAQNYGLYVVNNNVANIGAYSLGGSSDNAAWQFICLQFYGSYGNFDFWVNGANVQNGSITFVGSGGLTFNLSMANGPLTGLDNLRISNANRFTPNASTITVPTSVRTRDANTLVLWDFDASSGVGS